MIMKDLTSVEISVVSGGAGCTGGNTQMCVSATAKTAPTTGTCTSTVYGFDATHSVYYYCYVTGGSSTAAVMAAATTYCDATDDHYFQDATSAGKGVAGAIGSYASC